MSKLIRKPRVYVAGALSTLAPERQEDRTPSKIVVDYLNNVGLMIGNAFDILNGVGCVPYIPCLDLLLGAWSSQMTEDMYRSTSMSFLEVCDVVYVTSQSKGVEAGIKRAEELDIPVVYSHREIVEWADIWRICEAAKG